MAQILQFPRHQTTHPLDMVFTPKDPKIIGWSIQLGDGEPAWKPIYEHDMSSAFKKD